MRLFRLLRRPGGLAVGDRGQESPTSWIAAVGVGIVAALAFWWLSDSMGLRERPGPTPGEVSPDARGGVAQTARPDPGKGGVSPGVAAGTGDTMTADPAALLYVAGFQRAKWDDVIDVTCWMQERLLRVQMEQPYPSARESARARLRESLDARTLQENQLRAEGVEDKYVFTSEAVVVAVAVDKGQTDLERDVRSRTWFRVTYPERKRALRDDKGIPIRSVTVGVNVSADGFVLKSNVIGNLDIDWGSISSDWASVV